MSRNELTDATETVGLRKSPWRMVGHEGSWLVEINTSVCFSHVISQSP